jgi:D-3-phosphoglycerate dehydrogenase
MSERKILITDGLQEQGRAILRTAGQVDDREGISADELLRIVGEYHALVVRGRTKVTAELIREAKLLRVIGRAGVGVDNIDLSAASARNITVVNAPLSTSQAVAELTIGLLFALARSIPQADSSMKSGQWIKKQLEGIELSGKTLGIIGVGNIGCAVAQRALALGMQVIGSDTRKTQQQLQEVCVEAVSWAELLMSSEFLSLHVPLTDETRRMINGQAIAQMKRGIYIVCVARGGIIDETALLGGLESGQVAGAALDVFAQEPPGLTALVAHPKVIATPHIGAQTAEAQERAALDIATEVLAALQGERLRWKII